MVGTGLHFNTWHGQQFDHTSIFGGWPSRNQIEMYIPTVRIPNMGLMSINIHEPNIYIHILFLTMAHIAPHQSPNIPSWGSTWFTTWEHNLPPRSHINTINAMQAQSKIHETCNLIAELKETGFLRQQVQ